MKKIYKKPNRLLFNNKYNNVLKNKDIMSIHAEILSCFDELCVDRPELKAFRAHMPSDSKNLSRLIDLNYTKRQLYIYILSAAYYFGISEDRAFDQNEERQINSEILYSIKKRISIFMQEELNSEIFEYFFTNLPGPTSISCPYIRTTHGIMDATPEAFWRELQAFSERKSHTLETRKSIEILNQIVGPGLLVEQALTDEILRHKNEQSVLMVKYPIGDLTMAELACASADDRVTQFLKQSDQDPIPAYWIPLDPKTGVDPDGKLAAIEIMGSIEKTYGGDSFSATLIEYFQNTYSIPKKDPARPDRTLDQTLKVLGIRLEEIHSQEGFCYFLAFPPPATKDGEKKLDKTLEVIRTHAPFLLCIQLQREELKDQSLRHAGFRHFLPSSNG